MQTEFLMLISPSFDISSPSLVLRMQPDAGIQLSGGRLFMNSMKLAIPLHSLYWSIHTKDESKRETAFAFIFGAN